jgi:hypothetical protein
MKCALKIGVCNISAFVLALTVALGVSTPALAVSLHTVVSPIYQVGTTGTVHIGHTALASTNYNRLYAGGTYSVTCAGQGATTVSGQRFFSAENLFGGLQSTVTIPEWLPATVTVPGFNLLTRGQTIGCAYNWTSRAVESGFSIGAGGISFPIGNGEMNEGSAEPFNMTVRNTGDEDEGSTCIP